MMRVMKKRRPNMRSTSWQPVEQWYTSLVGTSGHYFHERIVLPGALRLLRLTPTSSLLDLACGQGVLSRHLASAIEYWGCDNAPALLRYAEQHRHTARQHFVKADVTRPLPITKRDFTHTAILLSLQNIEKPQDVIAQAHAHLRPHGVLVIVLNHPCFRIPRQSSWGIDLQKDFQYRRVDRYLSPMKIPITAHPGRGSGSPVTWSFHQPLSAVSRMLSRAGFVIEEIEEWTSDKKSEGRATRREDRSRAEFPLFLALRARKDDGNTPRR
jgi:SAM-dependent methyltransferase